MTDERISGQFEVHGAVTGRAYNPNLWRVQYLGPSFGEDRGYWAVKGGSDYSNWEQSSGPYDTPLQAHAACALVNQRVDRRRAADAAKEGRYNV